MKGQDQIQPFTEVHRATDDFPLNMAAHSLNPAGDQRLFPREKIIQKKFWTPIYQAGWTVNMG